MIVLNSSGHMYFFKIYFHFKDEFSGIAETERERESMRAHPSLVHSPNCYNDLLPGTPVGAGVQAHEPSFTAFQDTLLAESWILSGAAVTLSSAHMGC